MDGTAGLDLASIPAVVMTVVIGEVIGDSLLHADCSLDITIQEDCAASQ